MEATVHLLMFAILLCGNQDEKTESKEVVKIDKKMSRIPPEVAADAVYSVGLDETLVIIHKEEALFFDAEGKEIARIKGLKSPWLVRSATRLLVFSTDAVLFCKGNGEITSRIDNLRSPMPLMGTDDEIVGFNEMKYHAEKTRVSILDNAGNVKTQYELPLGHHFATRVPGKDAVLFVIQQQSIDMFGYARTQIWLDGKLLRDISEPDIAIGFLGATRSGVLFFVLAGKGGRSIIAVGEDGKDHWRRPITEGTTRIQSSIGRAKSGSDVLLVGYEDKNLTDGLLRTLIIDGNGKIIRDVSNMSYGIFSLVTGTDYRVLKGKEKIHCVELSSGKVLWEQSVDTFLSQKKLYAFGWFQVGGSTHLLYSINESKPKTNEDIGESHIMMTNLETGKVVEESIQGTGWRVCPNPYKTVWIISGDGKVVSIKIR